MKFYNKVIISLFILLSYIISAFSQEFSRSSLTYYIGKGALNVGEAGGKGFFFGTGYQLDIWKDRLRINPTVTFGNYDAQDYLDAPDQSFYSINIEAIIFYDLIKIKAISLTIGAGGVLNNAKGLTGTGGYIYPVRNSYYFSQWNYGAYVGCGIRIVPKKSRFFVEIMPLNLHILSKEGAEEYSRIGFGVKL